MSSPSKVAGSYKVKSLKDVPTTMTMTIDLKAVDSTTVEVSAKIANYMSGTWKLADGVYTGGLISTRRGGPPEMMKVERFLNLGSDVGFTMTRVGKQLTLAYNGDTLVLTAK